MATYFTGFNNIGPRKIVHNNRTIELRVTEHWVDLDQDLTSDCGAAVEWELEYSIGTNQKILSAVESTLSASLGVKDVAGIGATVKETMGVEVSWLRTREESAR